MAGPHRAVMIPLAALDIDAFYQAIATISFVLLGLWWLVAQVKYEEWRGDPARRRHAYGISLYFLLPGMMALAASVNSDVNLLWRVAFGITGVLGTMEVLLYLRSGPLRTAPQLALRLVGSIVYLSIVVLAIKPTLAMGTGLKPREVEGLLLTVLLFIGANIAWFGLMETGETAGA